MAHDYKQTLTGLLYKSRNCEYATLQKRLLNFAKCLQGFANGSQRLTDTSRMFICTFLHDIILTLCTNKLHDDLLCK